MAKYIRTMKYGIIPTAVNDTYLSNDVLDTVECDNGDFYIIKMSFTGAIVALLS